MTLVNPSSIFHVITNLTSPRREVYLPMPDFGNKCDKFRTFLKMLWACRK